MDSKTAQGITTIEEFIKLRVPESEKHQFQETIQKGSLEDVQRAIGRYATGLTVKEVGQIEASAKKYAGQPNQTQQISSGQYTQETTPEDIFSELFSSVAESGTEIIGQEKVTEEDKIALLEKDRQQAELLEAFYKADGDKDQLTALLKKMDAGSKAPESLFQDRVGSIDSQVQELGLSEEQKAKLAARKQVIQDEWQKKTEKAGKDFVTPEQWADRIAKADPSQREKYFRALLNRQLGRTMHIDGLLYEEEIQTTLLGRFPGLLNNPFFKRYTQKVVKKSILSKKQLKALQKTQKKTNNETWKRVHDLQKERDKNPVAEFQPIQEPFIQEMPEMPLPYPDEAFESDESTPPQNDDEEGGQDSLGNLENAKQLADLTEAGEGAELASTAATGATVGAEAGTVVAGAGAVEGAGMGAGLAVATAPEWGLILGILGLILLVLFLVIIVFIVLQNQGGNPYTAPISFATCGDASLGANDANLFAQEFNKRYQKNKFYGIILTAGGGDNATLLQGETEFYSDLCVLFGHLQGFTYKPDVYNTFGTLVMGTNKQIQDMQTVGIHITITAADTTDPCYFKLNSITNGTPSWTFFYNSSCSTGRARFIIAQNLAHNLVLQQQHLKKVHAPLISSADVFNNFSSAYGSTIMTKDTILPTNDCLNNINYGEGEKDQQNRDCFADMVGTFATYPIYYDSPITSQMGGDSASESATFTSPLSTFPTGGYAEYYTFAKDYLFDGVDFYTSSNSSVLAWADTIDKRLTKAGGTNFDQFTPSANQDTTTCELKVDPIVGNFKDTENPGPACTSLYRAYKANDLLYTVRRRGVPGNTSPMNKLRYWCTDFVIDVFNLASGQRILGENVGMVVYMQQFFAQQSTNPKSGLGFLNYDKDHHVLSQVKPGAAIFFIQTNDGQPHEAEHTGIVTSISIDNNGNGSIHTDEANNMGAKPQYVYPVSNWDIENAPFPVRGFGFLE